MSQTEYNKAYWQKNKDRLREKNALYRKQNSLKLKESEKLSRVKNVDKRRASNAAWRAKNASALRAKKLAYYEANKGAIRARTRAWAKAYPERVRSNNVKRLARELRATPRWANEFFIEEAYHLARFRTEKTGIKWHVDHIVPLRSKLVCGLHVESNLQVIPAFHNISKGNRRWPDMP